MVLFIYISSREDTVRPILVKMAENGFHGATMVDCEGMLQSVYADSIEPPPLFSGLREFLNAGQAPGKMLFSVMREEQVETAKEIVHAVCGSLDAPNSGILFTVPVSNVEGVC